MLTSCTELTRYCIEIIFWVKAYHKKIHFSIEAEEKNPFFRFFCRNFFCSCKMHLKKNGFIPRQQKKICKRAESRATPAKMIDTTVKIY